MSQSAFCYQHGLAISTFQYWRKRLREAGDNDAALAANSAFVPVRVNEAVPALSMPSGTWACEVVGPRGVKIRLRERPSVARLQELVGILEGALR